MEATTYAHLRPEDEVSSTPQPQNRTECIGIGDLRLFIPRTPAGLQQAHDLAILFMDAERRIRAIVEREGEAVAK